MTGLLNLLTALAALLNLTTGCGLPGRRINGQSLLSLGTALARHHLAGNSASGTLQGVGSALGGTATGSLLGGIGSLSSDGLVSRDSGLTPTGSASALGTLRAGFVQGAGGSLLSSLGKLAADRLSGGGSSAGMISGSNMRISGQQLQQGILQSGEMAGGFFVAATAASSSATRTRTQLGGISDSLSVGATVNQRPGPLLGVISSGGPRPGPGGVIPATNSLQGLQQGTHQMRQTVSRASLTAAGAVMNSASTSGALLPGRTTGNAQNVGANLAAATSVAGVLSGGGGAGSASGYTVNPRQAFGQGIQPAGQIVSQGYVTASGATTTTATGGMGGLGLNAIRNIPDGVVAQGRGVPLGGASRLDPGLDSNGRISGQAQGPGAEGPLNGVGTVGALLRGEGALQASRTNWGGPSGGSPITGVGMLPGQRLPQDTQGGTIGLGSSVLQSTAGMTTQTAGGAATTFLNVASSLSGASGGAAPGVGIGPGPRGPGSGPASLVEQGLAQSTRERDQTLGGGTIRQGVADGHSTVGLTNQIAGTSATTLLNAPTNLNGVPSGAAPGIGITPSPTGAVTGNNPVQGLGQGAPQAGRPLGGIIIGSGSATHHSTTSIGTQVSGRFPGVNLGQGPMQGSQITNQGQSGGSILTVSSSRHSSSRYQAHVFSGSGVHVGGGISSPGGNAPALAAPSEGSELSRGGSSGTNLMGAIVEASTGGHPVGGSATGPANGLPGLVSSSTRISASNAAISGITQHRPLPQRKRMGAAAATGLALGTMAGALALGALGTGIASALQNGMIGGGRPGGGCPGRGCRSGCGRKRRSVAQSKVPAEVLNNIPMEFNRPY